jgi:hypothetical protein
LARKRLAPANKTEISEAQWKTLEQMAADLCTHDEMADYLGVSKRTFYAPHLRERFEALTKKKRAATLWNVRKRQREKAENGQPVDSIWFGKQHLGQTDRQQVTGAGGGPLELALGATEHLTEILDKALQVRRGRK